MIIELGELASTLTTNGIVPVFRFKESALRSHWLKSRLYTDELKVNNVYDLSCFEVSPPTMMIS